MIALLAAAVLYVLPQPESVTPIDCSGDRIAIPRSAPRSMDPGALDVINERWRAVGIGELAFADRSPIRFARDASMHPQAYRLHIGSDGIVATSADSDGAFNAMMTLAQLPTKGSGEWRVPCVEINDAPKLKWRILSDDVSRGPLPTMRYFKERIRTIAAFKMNGYSPYMEHVYVSRYHSLAAPADGITPLELRDLAAYARRFHVTLIPEQQTFAHLHGFLRQEVYAGEAEWPHGFLMSADRAPQPFLGALIDEELRMVGPVPFFHIGSDETSTLGEGNTAAYVAAHGGRSAVFAQHINAFAKLVSPARVMLWDDAIEQDPGIMKLIPKNAVIVNWHYGVEPSYKRYIDLVASGGFDQMVAPGASNWNEIYPNVTNAIANETTFVNEGIDAHVLGLFQTVWHDDGETLYETTWYPVLYAGAIAWNPDSAGTFESNFSNAFFGGGSIYTAIQFLNALTETLHGSTNKMFWADPFGPSFAERVTPAALSDVRTQAERIEEYLNAYRPPMHQSTVDAMLLAAKRFDALGRRYQIAQEVRFYYDHAATHPDDAVRDLFWCKYWFWEQRDMDEELAALYEKAWRYESRDGHLASNLERYHLDAQEAIRRADAIDRVTYDVYLKTKTLPPLDTVIK